MSRGLPLWHHTVASSGNKKCTVGLNGQTETSIIVVTHNEREQLANCLRSLYNQSCQGFDIIVVDNASEDGTVDFVRKHYPSVKVLASPSNLGYPGGINVGAKLTGARYLVLLSADVELEEHCLESFLGFLESNPNVAGVGAKVIIKELEKINASGVLVHYTGLPFARGYGEDKDNYDSTEPVASFSGAACMVRKDVFDQMGGSDENLFLYMEDIDFSWRSRLMGYEIIYLPKAIIFHKHQENPLNLRKFYYVERNRLVLLLKNYEWRTLVALIPPLALAEVLAWAYALRLGKPFVAAKFRSYEWIAKNRRLIWEKRRLFWPMRKVGDAHVSSSFTSKIPLNTWHFPNASRLMRCALLTANFFFEKYYQVLIKIYKWNDAGSVL